MALDNKEITTLLKYLDKEGISPLNALEIVKKANTINPSNYRSHWKTSIKNPFLIPGKVGAVLRLKKPSLKRWGS